VPSGSVSPKYSFVMANVMLPVPSGAVGGPAAGGLPTSEPPPAPLVLLLALVVLVLVVVAGPLELDALATVVEPLLDAVVATMVLEVVPQDAIPAATMSPTVAASVVWVGRILER
jgi:hypothetical protein